jgi:predicted amidophosphoribosyltransferase
MGIAIFFILAVLTVAAIAYPLLPGRTPVYPVPVVTDNDIDRAVRDLRRARSRGDHLCPTCNKNYQPGDRFCVRCGGELPQVEAVSGGAACPACGAAMQTGDQFCPKCGHKMVVEEVA